MLEPTKRREHSRVRSLQAWLESARTAEGPVFRSLDRFQRVQAGRLSDKAVALVVKRRAKAVGLDPARYAGHSLRAGLATSAAAGASERVIMSQTGHRSADMVRRYIRDGSLFTSNPAADGWLVGSSSHLSSVFYGNPVSTPTRRNRASSARAA
jgi:integrase